LGFRVVINEVYCRLVDRHLLLAGDILLVGLLIQAEIVLGCRDQLAGLAQLAACVMVKSFGVVILLRLLVHRGLILWPEISSEVQRACFRLWFGPLDRSGALLSIGGFLNWGSFDLLGICTRALTIWLFSLIVSILTGAFECACLPTQLIR